MIKILYIHHGIGWGGSPINLIANIQALDKERFEPTVLLLKSSVVLEELKERNINCLVAKSFFYKKFYRYFSHSEAGYVKFYHILGFIRKSISWLLSRYYFAGQELNQLDYDIYQINSSVLTDWLVPCKKKGKVVFHIQEPFRKGKFDVLHHFFRYQINKYADRIIAISYDNASRIRIPNKTTVIYNFVTVNNNPLIPNSYYSKSFLYLGGNAKIKGFYTMVKALDFLDTDVKIYFGGYYGNTKLYLTVKNLIHYLLIGNRRRKAIMVMRNHPNAIEVGMIKTVSVYLQKVCGLISPFSTPHFSRPVIEAFLHQKAAIGSDVKGMTELIENGRTGLIFEKDNEVELAKAINFLANHPEQSERMGRYAYDIAIEKYSPRNAAEFMKVYNQLTNE